MGLGDADFVDPQLWAFVGVDVVHSGRHADYVPIVEGDYQVMTFITEEFCGPSSIDLSVEHIRRNVQQNVCITGAQ